MHRSIGLAVVLVSIACGARAEGGDATAALSESSSASGDPASSSAAASIGSADGSGGTAGFVPLAIDFPVDAVPYCVTEGATVHDYLVPGSGDGSPITCTHAAGAGGGALPAGVSIDAETCAVIGEPPADRFGTWVVIVRAAQGDVEVFVPYCITQDQAPDDDALIEVVTGEATDAALLPLHGTFAADTPLAIGGADDPRFRIIDPSRCGESCSYSYQFFVTASAFDLEAGPFIVDDMIIAEDGDPIGIGHGLELSGMPVADTNPELAARPWVFGLELDYCLAEAPGACDPLMRSEAAARFRYSVVMSPE